MRRVLRHVLAGTAIGVATTVAVTGNLSDPPEALSAAPLPVPAAVVGSGVDARSDERAERIARSAARSRQAQASAPRAAALLTESRQIRATERALEQRAAAERRAKVERRKAEKRRKAEQARREAKARGYDIDTTAPRAIARQIMANKFGWGRGQFRCYDLLIKSESAWRVDATNPSSGAYGIPQALPARKMASAGDDWRTNPATQIRWGLRYVKVSYGTPCSAWSFKQGNNWY